MVQVNNTTSIYRNVKTGVYFVQPYTLGPVAATEFGDATIVTPEKFDSSIAEAVLQNLEKFGKEQYDRSRAIIRNQKQQKDFIKNHVGVTINQHDSGELVIYALHRERGGWWALTMIRSWYRKRIFAQN